MSTLVDALRLEAQQHSHRIQILPIVVLYLNNVCDSKCQTCSIWRNNEWLRVAAERQMSDQLLVELYGIVPAWRPRQILLSGGEPVLHPRFGDAVETFKRLAGKVCVITNGLLLNTCDSVVLRQIDEFYISFDAADPESYRKIRGVDGIDRLSASIGRLRALHRSPRIVARCTLQRDNVRRIPELISAARRMGFDSISFLAVDIGSQAFSRDQHGGPDVAAIRPSSDDLKIMAEDVAAMEDLNDPFIEGGPGKLRRIRQYLRALIDEDEFPPVRCNAPWTSIVIETTGKIRGCFFQPVIGDFRNINGERAVEFRRQLKVNTDSTCQRCVCSKFVSTRGFLRGGGN